MKEGINEFHFIKQQTEGAMRKTIALITAYVLATVGLQAQSGSINNTLGSGGSFTVKNSASDPLVVVDETGNAAVNGQLTVDRIRVSGVPSFFVTHNPEGIPENSPSVLTIWSETDYLGSHDNSDSFNPSTGQFTVPRDGFYFLSAYIGVGGAGTLGMTLVIRTVGNFTGLQAYVPTTGGVGHIGVSGVLRLTVGEIVTVVVHKPDGQSDCTAADGYFSGYLVSDF